MNIQNLKTLYKIFFEEKECIKFLINKKIIKKPEKCHSCNREIYLYLKENVFRYRNLDYFRNLAINSLISDDEIVGGPRIIVEIDKSLFNDFWVIGGLTIYTDGWHGYQNLESLGMKHILTNHSRPNQQQRIRRIHTNTIEETWNLLKIFILKPKRQRNIIEPLLKEFIFREKHKNNL
ncbi:4566_t:CDS:2 [Dentiscutata erythropus]|uniref:4566_t:CDS:1 n=1 Tax=Dentiscutata erythropus TaxID=1348616 RepID=A0A9N9A2Q2_9GLOM|nr:4566_t:CDS:2 [Dentiscutata erythropus]